LNALGLFPGAFFCGNVRGFCFFVAHPSTPVRDDDHRN